MRSRLLVAVLAVVAGVALAGCGGDDAAGGDAAADSIGQEDPVAAPPAVAGLEVPAGYPLPVPEGGSLQRVLVDEGNGTSNIALLYGAGTFDALVAAYDDFFAGVGDTIKAGPDGGLASWQSATEGYSVVINDQGSAVSVVLQTGV